MWESIKKFCGDNGVELVAVSKTHTIDAIKQLYDQGQLDFAENKVQELVQKYENLPKDIRWHFIGHLQTNKVKLIAGFISMIQSVDSLKLCMEIQKQAAIQNRTIDCLLQIKIASEDSKYGIPPENVVSFIDELQQHSFPNIQFKGVMGMSTFTQDESVIKTEFLLLKSIFDQVKTRFKDAHVLSMGMSSDYQLAIEMGSNMVRIGSLIFGQRNYQFT
jgi:PLP dependent protein